MPCRQALDRRSHARGAAGGELAPLLQQPVKRRPDGCETLPDPLGIRLEGLEGGEVDLRRARPFTARVGETEGVDLLPRGEGVASRTRMPLQQGQLYAHLLHGLLHDVAVRLVDLLPVREHPPESLDHPGGDRRLPLEQGDGGIEEVATAGPLAEVGDPRFEHAQLLEVVRGDVGIALLIVAVRLAIKHLPEDLADGAKADRRVGTQLGVAALREGREQFVDKSQRDGRQAAEPGGRLPLPLVFRDPGPFELEPLLFELELSLVGLAGLLLHATLARLGPLLALPQPALLGGRGGIAAARRSRGLLRCERVDDVLDPSCRRVAVVAATGAVLFNKSFAAVPAEDLAAGDIAAAVHQ